MERHPHFAPAAAAWALAETGRITGLLAAHSLPTLFYLYAKHASREKASYVLLRLLEVFKVADIAQETVEAALALGWADFEDALQMAAAAQSGCSNVVTRNPKDFPAAPVAVISPVGLLAILS